MRLFSKALSRDAAFWFTNLKARSFCSWTEFYNTFLKYWGENKSFNQYLIEFDALRRDEDEAITKFSWIF